MVKLLICSNTYIFCTLGHHCCLLPYHISGTLLGGHKAVRSIICSCIVCRHWSSRPSSQMMGQHPPECITPDAVFSKVGMDYAGPVQLERGLICKPVVVKPYECVCVINGQSCSFGIGFQSTSKALIACLQRFIARKGKPILVTTVQTLLELNIFLLCCYNSRRPLKIVSNFCSSQGIC